MQTTEHSILTSEEQHKREKKGYAVLIAALFLVAPAYLIGDYSFRTFELSADLFFLHGLIYANVVLSFVMLPKKSVRTRVVHQFKIYKKFLILISLMSALAGYLWYVGISLLKSDITSLLEEVGVIYGVLIAYIFKGERLSKREILALIIALIGIGFTASLKGRSNIGGVIALLVSQLIFSYQAYLLSVHAQERDGTPFMYIRNVMILIFFGVTLLLLGKTAFIPIIAVILATIAQLFIFAFRVLWAEALVLLNHKFARLNIVMLVKPILVIMGTTWYFSDPLTLEKLLGVLLILGGLFIFYLQQKQKEDKEALISE